MLAPHAIHEAHRAIVHRTSGHTRGPITRLVSPSDLGEVMKPFVFLDLAVFDGRRPGMPIELGWHPHSGIATVTVTLEGSIRYADATGAAGVLPPGSVEWMRAGGGVWHTGTTLPGPVRAFQLWIALPPALEQAPATSRYVMPDEVPVVGPARVILGSYGDATSAIDAPPMTYLSVRLAAGERWRYLPAPGHRTAWIAVARGALRAVERVAAGELAVFEESEAPIDLVGETDADFVLGSAARHPHDLHLGSYSVHTSAAALRAGEEEIRRIGRRLMADGTFGPAATGAWMVR
jgi:redox-sensitive bicupin YhaK (pirin superfamily)